MRVQQIPVRRFFRDVAAASQATLSLALKSDWERGLESPTRLSCRRDVRLDTGRLMVPRQTPTIAKHLGIRDVRA